MLPRLPWCAPVALALLACGDSGTDSGGDSSRISVDEASRLVTIHNQQQQDACILKSDSILSWEPLYGKVRDQFIKYDFFGDTLVLYWCQTPFCHGDSLDNGDMMVGGKEGSLFGTWHTTPCYITDGASVCDSTPPAQTYTYKFSDDAITTAVNDEDDEETHYSFTNSLYMADLLQVINEGGSPVGIHRLFESDSLGVVALIATYQNQVLFRSSKAMDLKVGDRTFSIKLNDISGVEAYQCSVSISVASDDTTCVLDYESSEVIERSMCNADGKKYLDFVEIDPGTLENPPAEKFRMADSFKKSNEREFGKCLAKIAGST